MDFVSKLDTDTLLSILSCLDDPSDLVRASASAVSRSWRDFGLSKKLCFKLFYQLTCVDRVNEESSWSRSSLMDTKLLEREHKAFALLAKGCTSSPIRSCIADAIIASSTHNFRKSILNTLDEIDQIGDTPSYWSSSGQQESSVPETLLYKLKGDLCVVTEFSIHPFQAYFQPGSPIYSLHYVRFRLGHLDNNNSQEKDNYVWTYTSQEFAMAQVVSHVRVMGRSLANSFRLVDPDDESEKFGLMVVRYCDPKEMGETEVEEEVVHRQFRHVAGMENLQRLFNFLRRYPVDAEYAWHDGSS
ncbi:unnamed protein product [Brassica napus]|uniref:F-box domain-containing protein n=2 Tax=Brassica TaxID=3705 RepID=A0A3P6AHY2_BRAOL|nr:unnamed protein product [Brassica napus]VDC92112.1 unnamed protein product [Brassica oleracea]